MSSFYETMNIQDQGAENERYKVIPRVLIFVFNKNGQALLLKGAKDKRLWAEKWNGIGGHVEVGESIKSAAIRELVEESGIIANDLNLCGLVTIDTKQIPGIMMFVYSLLDYEGPIVESNEGILAWIDLKKLDRINCVEDIPFLVEKIEAAKSGEKPFYAQYTFDEDDRLMIACN